MKSALRGNLAWGLYGAFIGSAATLATVIMLLHGAILIERRSPHDFATTVQTISANAERLGWKVSKVEDFEYAPETAEELRKAPVAVIELCHPGHACNILKSGKRSCMAMMPCSVAVYERDGQVYVASVNHGLIGRFFRLEAAGVLRKVRADEREILRLAALR